MNRQVSNKLDKSPHGITYYRGKKLTRFNFAEKVARANKRGSLRAVIYRMMKFKKNKTFLVVTPDFDLETRL